MTQNPNYYNLQGNWLYNLLSNCNYNLQGNNYYILQGNHYYILQGNNYYNLKGNWNWKKIYITNKVLVTYAVYNKRNHGKSAVSLQTWSILPSVSMVYITWHGPYNHISTYNEVHDCKLS